MAKLTHDKIADKGVLDPLKKEFRELITITETSTAKIKELKQEFSETKSIKSSKDVAKLSDATARLAKEKKTLSDAEKKLEEARKRSLAQIKQEQNANSKLQAAQKETISIRKKGQKSLTETRIKTQELNKANRLLARETLGLIKPHEKLTRATDKAQKEFKDLAAQFGVNSTQARKASKRFETLDDRLRKVNNRARDGRRDVGRYGLALTKLRSIAVTGLGILGLTSLVAGLGRAITGTIAIFSSFEKTNSTLKAVLGATENQMIALNEQQKDLGATTAFTATQVAELGIEFAKLGFPTAQILEMTESTLNAAAAMGSDLAGQAKLTGAILKTYKLDASEATRVNDVLAKSTTSSALDFEKLASSMSTIAPVAKSFGFGLEGTVTLLGSLSDAGFDASSAATATRNILLNLADANSKLGKSLKEPVTDLPSLVRGLKQLKSEGIDLGKALELTDKRSVAAFSTFLDGTDDILKLNEALEGATGTAQEMADVMLDNLAGSVTKFQSALEGLILSLEDGQGGFAGFLRDVVDVSTELLALATGTEKATDELNDAGLRIREVALNVIRLGKVIGILITSFITYKLTITAVNIATKAYTVVTNLLRIAKIALAGGIGKASRALKLFSALTKTSGIGVLVALLGAAVLAFRAFSDGANEAADAQRELNEQIAKGREADKSIADRFAILNQLNKQQLQNLISSIDARKEELTLTQELTKNQINLSEQQERLSKLRKGEINDEKLAQLALEQRIITEEEFLNLRGDATSAIALGIISIKDIIKAQEEEIGVTNLNVQAVQKKIDFYNIERKAVQDRLDFLNSQKEATKAVTGAETDLIKKQLILLKKAKDLISTDDAQQASKNRLIQTIEEEIKRLRALGIEKDKDKDPRDAIEQVRRIREARKIARLERAEQDTQAFELRRKELITQAQFEISTEGKTASERLVIAEKLATDLENLRNEEIDHIKAEEKEKVTLAKESLNKIREESKALLSEVERQFKESIDRRNEIANQQVADDIERKEASLRVQQGRAERGLENTLAREEAQLEKARLARDRQLEEQRKKEEEFALFIALLNQFAALSSQDPNAAAFKALRNTLVAKTLAETFLAREDGGLVPGPEQLVLMNEKGPEFVLDAPTTKALKLDKPGSSMDDFNKMLAGNKDADIIKDVENFHSGNTWSFMQNMQQSPQIDIASINKAIEKGSEKTADAIERHKAVFKFDVEGLESLIFTTNENGQENTIKYLLDNYNLTKR